MFVHTASKDQKHKLYTARPLVSAWEERVTLREESRTRSKGVSDAERAQVRALGGRVSPSSCVNPYVTSGS